MTRSGRRDSGAAAVEFALVLVFLIPLVFGAVDYGRYFVDQAAVQDAVRQAARSGSMAEFSTSGCPGESLQTLACSTERRTGMSPEVVSVEIEVLPDGVWEPGAMLRVCAVAEQRGLIGFVPTPHDGTVRAEVTTRIEQGGGPGGSHAEPSGTDICRDP